MYESHYGVLVLLQIFFHIIFYLMFLGLQDLENGKYVIHIVQHHYAIIFPVIFAGKSATFIIL